MLCIILKNYILILLFIPTVNVQPTLSSLTLNFHNCGLDWFILGICLYLPEEELLDIDKRNYNNPMIYLIKTFSMWLRLNRNGHWNDIFAAVSNAGEMECAASVISKLKTEEEHSKGNCLVLHFCWFFYLTVKSIL